MRLAHRARLTQNLLHQHKGRADVILEILKFPFTPRVYVVTTQSDCEVSSKTSATVEPLVVFCGT